MLIRPGRNCLGFVRFMMNRDEVGWAEGLFTVKLVAHDAGS